MLGLSYERATVLPHSIHYKPSFPIPVYVDNFTCSGNEKDYEQCKSLDWFNSARHCSHGDAAYLECNTPIKLLGGINGHSGIVQVYNDSKWKHICFKEEHLVNLRNAQVLCYMEGLSTSATRVWNSTMEGRKETMSVYCNGNEKDITFCRRSNDTCQQVLSFECATQTKLVNGRTRYMGQVEVEFGRTTDYIYRFEGPDTISTICRILNMNFTSARNLEASNNVYFLKNEPSTSRNSRVLSLKCNGNETDIIECLNSTTLRTVSSFTNYGINCQTPLRLAGGKNHSNGLLEMRINKTWYQVCSDGFIDTDASVICRMSGHQHSSNAKVIGLNSSGDFLLGKWNCTGNELDVSLCSGYSEVLSSCRSTQAVVIDCSVRVRLVDGPYPTKGRVEVFNGSKWGPVCRIGIGSYEGNVICRSAGFKYSYGEVNVYARYSNKTFQNFTVTNLDCTGHEEGLTECKSDEWMTGHCPPNGALEVNCKSRISLSGGLNKFFGRVDLQYLDRFYTRSGTVCGDYFTSNDADIICNLVGAPTQGNASIYNGNKFGTNGNLVVQNLTCKGDEHDIEDCPSTPWSETHNSCNISNRAVAINCRPHTPLRLRNSSTNASSGIVEAFFDGSWLTICQNGLDDKVAAVVCRGLGYKAGEFEISQSYDGSNNIYYIACKGTENDISECQNSGYTWTRNRCGYKSAAVKCSNTRVQLRDGINRYEGRVEFQYNGIKGTICSEHFDEEDALVVCRAANIPGVQNATIYQSSKYRYGSSSLSVADDLNCTGTEDELEDCAAFLLNANYPCSTHRYDVGVNCRPRTPIRLANGTKYSGRVEIEYDGKWGTICDRDFDDNDAKVICRMLGYSTRSVEVKQNAYYGIGAGHIIISNLACDGNEPDISECLTNGYKWSAVHGYCTARNDVAVQCNTPTRVMDGKTAYSGVAQVYFDGAWRHICKDNFTSDDMMTFCNVASLRNNYTGNVSIVDASFYGVRQFVNQPVGSFKCRGDESDLFECGSGHWTNSRTPCTSGQIVALNCRADSSVRLVNEDNQKTYEADARKNSSTGRVEVFYMGKWGTICDDLFDDQDAKVLCSMMGYSIGRVNRETDNQYGEGNIVIDDLECTGMERDISQCKSREWGTHNCIWQENVFIDCDFQENIDPCEKNFHDRLPNLEQRTVNYKTNSVPINDQKLPEGWYYVGNVTMPSKQPHLNSCGTNIPIFTASENNFTTNNGILSIKAEETGNETVTYDIQRKNCSNNFFVYYLTPTRTLNSGYCFGIGSIMPPPTFVAASVQTILMHNNTTIWFKCKFDTETSHKLFYRVFWIVDGDTTIVKGYCSAADNMAACLLTEYDFKNNSVGMGDTISCSVRAYYESDGQPGQMSEQSEPFFIGIKVLTPSITLRHGETKPIEMQLTVPIRCTDFQYKNAMACNVSLQYFVPEHDLCKAQGVMDSCDKVLNESHFPHKFEVNVSTAANGQYGVAGQFSIFFQIPQSSYRHFLFWKTYKLAPIQVKVLPESDTKWRGKVCAAKNDPHMFTFDQRSFEHHADPGDYVLYKHKLYDNVEIQHRIGHCTNEANKAKCNCGLGVRAGRDVYIINVCNNYIDIGYKMCLDQALSVKKDNDFTYTIYLPYGTAVRARIYNAPFMGNEGGRVLDLTVMPSLNDRDGNSTGLCGSLNDDQHDDMDNQTDIEFIRKWKVNDSLSLFNSNVHQRNFSSFILPSCVCKNEGKREMTCEKSLPTCTKGSLAGFHSCDGVPNRRSVRSVSTMPGIPTVRIPASNPSLVRTKREIDETRQWTRTDAERYCLTNVQGSKAFELCKKVPATHTNISLENCILDIMLMNSTSWTSISRQSMQDTCLTQIHRNKTVIDVLIKETELAHNTSVPTPTPGQYISTPHPPIISLAELHALKEMETTIKEIQVLCINNCSGHGICDNGTCNCDKGFGAVDCSLDTLKPPIVTGVLDEGLCDENKTDCTHAFVFGGIFAGSDLKCKLQYFNIDISGMRHQETNSHEVTGDTETLTEAICPLAHARRRRAIDSNHFVQGYKITLTNDGQHFSNDSADVYIFNSHCQEYHYENTHSTESEIKYTFTLKDGFCYIEGHCMFNGSMHISDSLICDPSISKTGWTPVTTTTRTSTASSSTLIPKETFKLNVNDTYAALVKKSNDAKEEVDIFRVEIILNYNVPEHDHLEIASTYETYKTELKEKLTHFYRTALGQGLKDVYILEITTGSLHVDHAIKCSTDGYVEKALARALVQIHGKSFLVFNETAVVHAMKMEGEYVVGEETENYKHTLFCNIFTKLHPCEDEFHCEIVDEEPICRHTELFSTKDEIVEGTSQTVLIVSVSIGAFLVIVVAALVVILCKRKIMDKYPIATDRQGRFNNTHKDVQMQSLDNFGYNDKIPRAQLTNSEISGQTRTSDTSMNH